MDDIAPSELRSHRLEAGDISVTILSLGCITHDWRVPVGDSLVPVVLSYQDPLDHLRHPGSLGIIAGRVANRIANAKFTLDGSQHILCANEGANQLHGGPSGLARRNWTLEPEGVQAVYLRHHSPNGDQGFPGAVDFTIKIELRKTCLSYHMFAVPERPTPINLAQHSYYNLMGHGAIWEHQLKIASKGYTPTDETLIPTGELAQFDQAPSGTVPAEVVPFDFRKVKTIQQADPLKQGSDINLILTDTGAAPCATLTAPNGLRLKMWTDQPGLQLYTGAKLSTKAPSMDNQSHQPFSGLCLEPQHFPDSPNQPKFPSIICTPERPYHQRLDIEITTC